MNPVSAAAPRLLASAEALRLPRPTPDFGNETRKLPGEAILSKDIMALRAGAQALRDGKLADGTESNAVNTAFKAVYEIDANLKEALNADFLGGNRRYLTGPGKDRALGAMQALRDLGAALDEFAANNPDNFNQARVREARDAIKGPLERLRSLFPRQ
jgi:hypothetical protein